MDDGRLLVLASLAAVAAVASLKPPLRVGSSAVRLSDPRLSKSAGLSPEPLEQQMFTLKITLNTDGKGRSLASDLDKQDLALALQGWFSRQPDVLGYSPGSLYETQVEITFLVKGPSPYPVDDTTEIWAWTDRIRDWIESKKVRDRWKWSSYGVVRVKAGSSAVRLSDPSLSTALSSTYARHEKQRRDAYAFGEAEANELTIGNLYDGAYAAADRFGFVLPEQSDRPRADWGRVMRLRDAFINGYQNAILERTRGGTGITVDDRERITSFGHPRGGRAVRLTSSSLTRSVKKELTQEMIDAYADGQRAVAALEIGDVFMGSIPAAEKAGYIRTGHSEKWNDREQALVGAFSMGFMNALRERGHVEIDDNHQIVAFLKGGAAIRLSDPRFSKSVDPSLEQRMVHAFSSGQAIARRLKIGDTFHGAHGDADRAGYPAVDLFSHENREARRAQAVRSAFVAGYLEALEEKIGKSEAGGLQLDDSDRIVSFGRRGGASRGSRSVRLSSSDLAKSASSRVVTFDSLKLMVRFDQDPSRSELQAFVDRILARFAVERTGGIAVPVTNIWLGNGIFEITFLVEHRFHPNQSVAEEWSDKLGSWLKSEHYESYEVSYG